MFDQRIPFLSEDYAFYNSYEYSTFNQFKDVVTRLSILGRTINSLTDEDVRISNRLYLSSKDLRGSDRERLAL